MTRVDTPLHRDPLELEPRAVSAAAKARIRARDGQCKYPGCEVTEALEVDHIVALALGGKNTDDNLEALCSEHHKRKTKADANAIARCKRLHLAHTGQKPPAKQKIRSRGFERRWGDLAHD